MAFRCVRRSIGYGGRGTPVVASCSSSAKPVVRVSVSVRPSRSGGRPWDRGPGYCDVTLEACSVMQRWRTAQRFLQNQPRNRLGFRFLPIALSPEELLTMCLRLGRAGCSYNDSLDVLKATLLVRMEESMSHRNENRETTEDYKSCVPLAAGSHSQNLMDLGASRSRKCIARGLEIVLHNFLRAPEVLFMISDKPGFGRISDSRASPFK